MTETEIRIRFWFDDGFNLVWLVAEDDLVTAVQIANKEAIDIISRLKLEHGRLEYAGIRGRLDGTENMTQKKAHSAHGNVVQKLLDNSNVCKLY